LGAGWLQPRAQQSGDRRHASHVMTGVVTAVPRARSAMAGSSDDSGASTRFDSNSSGRIVHLLVDELADSSSVHRFDEFASLGQDPVRITCHGSAIGWDTVRLIHRLHHHS
jgi:hypothetical protein